MTNALYALQILAGVTGFFLFVVVSSFCLTIIGRINPQFQKWLISSSISSPLPPVHLLLLPARQLHGNPQLLVEAGRHAVVCG